MSAVRDFPKIKAIRSFVIGGVGSGMLPPASPSPHASPSRHLTRITQAVTTTMSKAATGKRTNLPPSHPSHARTSSYTRHTHTHTHAYTPVSAGSSTLPSLPPAPNGRNTAAPAPRGASTSWAPSSSRSRRQTAPSASRRASAAHPPAGLSTSTSSASS